MPEGRTPWHLLIKSKRHRALYREGHSTRRSRYHEIVSTISVHDTRTGELDIRIHE